MKKIILKLMIMISLFPIPPSFASELQFNTNAKQLSAPVELSDYLNQNELVVRDILDLPYEDINTNFGLNSDAPIVEAMKEIYDSAQARGESLSFLEVINRLPIQDQGIQFSGEKGSASIFLCLVTIFLICGEDTGGGKTRPDSPPTAPPSHSRPKERR